MDAGDQKFNHIYYKNIHFIYSGKGQFYLTYEVIEFASDYVVVYDVFEKKVVISDAVLELYGFDGWGENFFFCYSTGIDNQRLKIYHTDDFTNFKELDLGGLEHSFLECVEFSPETGGFSLLRSYDTDEKTYHKISDFL